MTAHPWSDIIAGAAASLVDERWTTAEAGGTTALLAILPDGRVISITASDGPFDIRTSEDDGEEVVVDGFLIAIWPTWDSRIDGENPIREMETGPQLADLAFGVADIVSP